MILTEKHYISKRKNPKLYEKIDNYCYKAKNLRNATNYVIKQCSRISYKLKSGEILDSYEKYFIKQINEFIHKNGNKQSYIDEKNGFIATSFFLNTYMKDSKEYKEMPYAVCSQKVIEHLCNDWKAFYEAMKEYKRNPKSFLGKPKTPMYYEKGKGRDWLTITYQQLKETEQGIVVKAKFLDGMLIKSSKKDVKQVSIKTDKRGIRVLVQYKVADEKYVEDNGRYLGIDLGVNNLATIVSNVQGIEPIIMNGKVLKSINQYYNKKLSRLRGIAKVCNGVYITKRMQSVVTKRNNKVFDYMHKVSHYIVNFAKDHNICEIVIGLNSGWKQRVDIGKRNTQTFVEIPYKRLIDYIVYKGKRVGIKVKTVCESYTSGTSYIDGEAVDKVYYNKSRRVKRGLFVSNNGIEINADVNGAYQIMRVSGKPVSYKGYEKVVRKQVA